MNTIKATPKSLYRVLTTIILVTSAHIASASEETWQDPTCAEVNESYLKTRAYPRYSVQMPLIREDGSSRPYMEYVVSEEEERVWRSFDKKWIVYPRVQYDIWDRFTPKFTECKQISQNATPEGLVTHYQTIWNEFPYKADTHIWISNQSDLLQRLRRHYLEDRWRFSEATVEEVFTYQK